MSSNLPFGFTPGDPDGPQNFDVNQLGAMLQQLGQMMQQSGADSGPVNWTMVRDNARQLLAAAGDPSVTDGERSATETAVDLAELWLDAATEFPATGGRPATWCRSEWLEGTLPAWQRIIDPVAEQVQDSMGMLLPGGAGGEIPGLPAGLPPEMAQMIEPLMGMAKQMGATMFSSQVAQALAALAGEVVSAGDVGIPLTSDGRPALLPANAKAFGVGLDVPDRDVLLFLALREAAHQRLFAHVAWLRPRLEAAVEEYARGIKLDTDQLTSAVEDMDMSNPEKLQEVLSSGVLVPEDSPEQRAALERLETLLALVEGWVDAVVTAAAEERLPNIVKLQEALRRRRAAGGPAEKTFATLVGLELRPRRLREAAALWAALTEARGQEGRDAVWAHPDLLPTSEDLEHPEAFVVSSDPTAVSSLEAELDALSAADEAGPVGGSEVAQEPEADAGEERGDGAAPTT